VRVYDRENRWLRFAVVPDSRAAIEATLRWRRGLGAMAADAVELVVLDCFEVVAAAPGEVAVGERVPRESGRDVWMVGRCETSSFVFPGLQ
jgi:hypothetical protein